MEKLPNEDWDKFLPYLKGDHDPNPANMDAPTPNFPYRLAQEINEFVIRQAQMDDHDISLTERDLLARQYMFHLIDQNAVEPAHIAFQALQIWRTQHGRDMRGEDG